MSFSIPRRHYCCPSTPSSVSDSEPIWKDRITCAGDYPEETPSQGTHEGCFSSPDIELIHWIMMREGEEPEGSSTEVYPMLFPNSPLLAIQTVHYCWCLSLNHSHILYMEYLCPICLFPTPGHDRRGCPNPAWDGISLVEL